MTGLAVRGSYGLQRAEDRTGSSLGNSPRHLVKMGAWRAVFRERLTLGAELNGLSQRIAANGSKVPGHAVVNLTIRTQNWPLGFSAGLSAYNLFDQAYGDPVSDDHRQAAIPQDRRNFRATVRYAF
jgi:outer membrane receptor protein involved in Fe transport